MHLFIKILITGTLLVSSANAMCAIQVCIPVASCAIGQKMIKLVGSELFMKEFFNPVINNSSGLLYRHPASRLVNMAKNEKMKSRGLEATARLEAQRYYLNKKGSLITTNFNKIKGNISDTEMMMQRMETLKQEMLLFLVSDKTNQKISQGKNKILGR